MDNKQLFTVHTFTADFEAYTHRFSVKSLVEWKIMLIFALRNKRLQLMNVTMIDNIRQYFSTQPVKKAWLFGSFSRGEETADSDVDILVEFDRSGKPITLLTYARILRELQERLGRDVDLVEEGTLKPFAVESANHDKQLIYERED